MSGELQAPLGVIACVEIAFLNLHPKHGMVVTVERALGEAALHRLPTGPLLPGEAPEMGASRVLAERVGIEDVHHRPLLLGHRAEAGDEGVASRLTLGFAVLGPRPSNSSESSTFVLVDHGDELLRKVDRPDTVLAAREAVKSVVETTAIAVRLLDSPGKPFTLKQLRAVYELVLGPGVSIDPANFRRKVEAAGDVVRPVEPPTTPSRPGRPAQWYVAGDADLLEPPIRLRV